MTNIKKLAAILYDENSNDLDIKIRLWTSVYEKAVAENDEVNIDKSVKKLQILIIEKDLQILKKALVKYYEINKKQNA